ncbi:MAG: adenosylcobinamide-GDP ribazoletransferase [Chloroflexota bacterium]
MAAAFSLLTRVPVRADGSRSGAAAFGVVGAILGAAAAAPLLLVEAPIALPPPVAAVLALAVLAVASGALHLDGLADTADALAAPTPDAAERARQDPRAGPAGVVAIVLVLGVDAAALAALASASGAVAGAAVLAAASASRSAATVAPLLGVATRPGFGSWFAQRTSALDAAIAVGTSLAVAAAAALVAGSPVPVAAATATLAAGIAAARIVGRLRNGLDGDGCGFAIELSFAAGLILASVAAAGSAPTR